MKIEIYSKSGLENRAKVAFLPNTVLVSIGDFGSEKPFLQNLPRDILRVEFDDITLQEVKEQFDLPRDLLDSDTKLVEFLTKKGVKIFDNQQANSIASFVKKHSRANVLICQCHYGQSRSAGCAAAIAEYFYGNGIDIFADDRYYPNKLVFRLVLNALKAKD